MPFGIAAAGISAGAGLIGGALQSSATSAAADKAIAAQQQALTQARADLAPYRTTGAAALGVAGNLSGANGPDAARAAQGDFVQSPGYQWQLDQGLRAVDAGAAAKGMVRSGATLKGEMTYGQGLASQDFASYYNRLAGLAGLGENAAAGSGNQSVVTGAGIGQTIASAGQQQSSIYGNAASGLSTGINKLFSNQTVADGTSANGLFNAGQAASNAYGGGSNPFFLSN